MAVAVDMPICDDGRESTKRLEPSQLASGSVYRTRSGRGFGGEGRWSEISVILMMTSRSFFTTSVDAGPRRTTSQLSKSAEQSS